ncbi:MAG: hypothetical protein ABIR96_06650 [Bdellovibrionota bacterium]
MTSGVAFFIGEGLFFLGLSLGIVGSTMEERSRQAAWIIMTIGGLSLLIAGLIVTYRRRKIPSIKAGRSQLRPLALSRAFDSLLQNPNASTLLKGEGFSTEIYMALSPITVLLPAGNTLILQHFAGLGASVQVDLQTSELKPGDILRLSSIDEPRSIELRAAGGFDDFEDAVPQSERAPQILAHFIEVKAPS